MREETEGEHSKVGRSAVGSFILIAAGVAVAALSGYFVSKFLAEHPEQLAAGEAEVHADRMYIDPGNADLVIEGRKIYEANCANCHGYGLEGQPNWRQRGPDGILPAPPHDETGHTWHHPDAVLFATVKSGGQLFVPQGVKSGMPGFGSVLTDREIEASIAYIKSRWPSKIRRQQALRNMQARPLRQ